MPTYQAEKFINNAHDSAIIAASYISHEKTREVVEKVIEANTDFAISTIDFFNSISDAVRQSSTFESFEKFFSKK